MAEGSVARASIEWRAVLGETKVVTDGEVLARYARSTEPDETHPACILYPESTEEVQAIARVASECGTPIYPISRGKNWGYGDTCAPCDGAAIIDLSRMNRIVEVNTELGYAVIEAGVSQQQLHDYLRSNNTRLWVDCTGAGGASSLVGNTLDRGFGHTRYGDHFLTACGMEVVLADGQVLHTGFEHFPNARASRVYRYGVGPFLDGIFCQANFGIVTRLGLWLMPEPEAFCFFCIRVARDSDLGPLVDCLRPLRMAGIIQTTLHIGNDLRLLSGTGRYPWEEAGGATPLPEEVLTRLRRAGGLGAWNVGGSLTGTQAHVRASKKAIKKAVGSLGSVLFVGDKTLRLGDIAVRILRPFGLEKGLARRLNALKPNYGLLKGVPTEEPLLGAQWRLRQPPAGNIADPLDAGCGLLWISPVVPMTGRDATRVMDLVKPIFAEFSFDPLATFTMINERAMIGILNIAYDKSDAEETVRAGICYDGLFKALTDEGYFPYRTGLRGIPKLSKEGDVFWEVAGRIKHALDPAGVIAPGRYVPRERQDGG